MSKRYIQYYIFVLALIVIAVFQISILNAQSNEFIIEDGVLTKYTGSGGDVTIPDNVTKIGASVFEKSKITSVIIPESVKYIGDSAFESCYDLTTVRMPHSINYLGYCAFYSCYKLVDITLPDNINILLSSTFFCCKSLKSIEIPDSVNEIGSLAFGSCSSLVKIKIPKSVRIINGSAFFATPWLKNNCRITNLFIVNGVVIDGTQTKGKVKIPSTVNCICNMAFAFNYNITEISIPDSVNSIGTNAFTDCNNMTSVKILNPKAKLGEGVFLNCTNLKKVTLPDKLKKIEVDTFDGCKKLTDIVIPDSVNSISMVAFQHCKNLRQVFILGNVKRIDAGAFVECNKDLTIYSKPNSYLEAYAKENGIYFVSMKHIKNAGIAACSRNKYTAVSKLMVKSKPTSKAGNVASLKYGQSVKVIEVIIGSDWVKVKLPNGRIGYCSNNFLTSTKPVN